VNGGNISDGPKKGSGNVIELKEVGGYDDNPEIVSHKDRQIAYLEKQVRRQKDENNLLSDRVRELGKEAKIKVEALRKMFTEQTDELVSARLTADKYITLCADLKDRIDDLETAQ